MYASINLVSPASSLIADFDSYLNAVKTSFLAKDSPIALSIQAMRMLSSALLSVFCSDAQWTVLLF